MTFITTTKTRKVKCGTKYSNLFVGQMIKLSHLSVEQIISSPNPVVQMI